MEQSDFDCSMHVREMKAWNEQNFNPVCCPMLSVLSMLQIIRSWNPVKVEYLKLNICKSSNTHSDLFRDFQWNPLSENTFCVDQILDSLLYLFFVDFSYAFFGDLPIRFRIFSWAWLTFFAKHSRLVKRAQNLYLHLVTDIKIDSITTILITYANILLPKTWNIIFIHSNFPQKDRYILRLISRSSTIIEYIFNRFLFSKGSLYKKLLNIYLIIVHERANCREKVRICPKMPKKEIICGKMARGW